MRLLIIILSLFSTIIISTSATAQKVSKKYKRILDEAVLLAETGNCDAIAKAANMELDRTDNNFDGLRDNKKGLELLYKGYALNCPAATVALANAIMYESEGKEFDSAINVLAHAAAAGYIEAEYKMGMLYMYGYGGYSFSNGNSPEWNIKPNYNLPLAAQCFKRAAEKGYQPAIEELEIAKLVADYPMNRALTAYNSHDYTTARKYFNYAAIGKDSVAMLYLGHIHLYGLGVKADNFSPAGTFYRQAGYNGMLSGFYISGMLQERFGNNVEWAKGFYEKGAERGSKECKDAIARINAPKEKEYDSWKADMQGRFNTDATNMNKHAQQQTCKMCYGSGKIVSPIQQDLYQDKNGRWYNLRGTQYESCWMCHGSGKM